MLKRNALASLKIPDAVNMTMSFKLENRGITPMTSTSPMIKGHQKLIDDLYMEGYSIWLCTVQFNHLGQRKACAIQTMQNEVERIYCLLLTRIVRNPRKTENRDLPVLIGCPDSPVPKHKPTAKLAEMLPNHGMHYHFALLVPRLTRLKMPLDQYVGQNIHVWLGKHGRVYKFDARPFTPIPGKSVADYVFKGIKRGVYTWDNVLILPVSRSELMRPNRSVSGHPAPDELRAAFRHLLAVMGDQLTKGQPIEVWTNGPDARMLLSIVPHIDRSLLARSGPAFDTDKPTRVCGRQSASSVNLIIPQAGERASQIGGVRAMMLQLEAIFAELVIRDRQFQTTPTYAKLARALAPLIVATGLE